MADVLAVRDEYRAEKWAAVIRECNASGLSNRAFCAQHGISEKSYYYWLKKLREQAAEGMPRLVSLDSDSVPGKLLQIRYRGAGLSLPAGVDLDAVAALLRSVQSL